MRKPLLLNNSRGTIWIINVDKGVHAFPNGISVTYWPSTQPSIKKQVHPVEDIKI